MVQEGRIWYRKTAGLQKIVFLIFRGLQDQKNF